MVCIIKKTLFGSSCDNVYNNIVLNSIIIVLPIINVKRDQVNVSSNMHEFWCHGF